MRIVHAEKRSKDCLLAINRVIKGERGGRGRRIEKIIITFTASVRAVARSEQERSVCDGEKKEILNANEEDR